MTVTDDLLSNAEQHAASFDQGVLPLPPATDMAIVGCTDARPNVDGLPGPSEGDAHIIRNAGGVVTQDELRSSAISRRLLGTTEVGPIHHTDCGILGRAGGALPVATAVAS